MKTGKLHIHGGDKVRTTPMPFRKAFGEDERRMISEVFNYYDALQIDPGYEGYFEKKYCTDFAQYMGGGFADAVATGTASLFIAIKALELPQGSSVLVSPITDPGTISAIILAGLRPKILDVKAGSYNVDFNEVKRRYDSTVSCVLIVHAAGRPVVDIKEIVSYAKEKNIPVIEDCSQSHGAEVFSQKVGTFADISCFSTMYRKASITGSSGGVVYTKNEGLYHQMIAHADRGKPRWKSDFDDRNPSQYAFPALNFNTDEISCAIGIASLARLEDVRRKRNTFINKLASEITAASKVCIPSECSMSDSPFYFPIFVRTDQISVSKIEFAKSLLEEGIPLSPYYNYIVADWPWLKPYLSDDFYPTNAKDVVDKSFNVYLNEQYGDVEILDIMNALKKVEAAYLR